MPKVMMIERPHPMVDKATQRLYRFESGTVMSAVRANDRKSWEAAVLDEDGGWLTRTIFPKADKLEQDVLFGLSESALLTMLDEIEEWEGKHQ